MLKLSHVQWSTPPRFGPTASHCSQVRILFGAPGPHSNLRSEWCHAPLMCRCPPPWTRPLAGRQNVRASSGAVPRLGCVREHLGLPQQHAPGGQNGRAVQLHVRYLGRSDGQEDGDGLKFSFAGLSLHTRWSPQKIIKQLCFSSD